MQNGACEKGRRHCAPVARGQSAFALGLSSLLRTKREPEMVLAPVRGGERFFIKADCSLLMSKENQKTTSDFDALDPTGCGTQRPLRALGGTRVLLTAAPTAPPCFRRRRRSSPLLLPRGGLGIPQSFASSPEAPLLGELAGASPTERLDGRRTARRSISLPVIEVINFHSTTFYHTFPLATRLNGQKTAKMGKKVEKMRRNHSAAAPPEP